MIAISSVVTSCESIGVDAGAMARVANSKDEVSLGNITSYKWDTVYIIGPYQTFNHSEINGVPQKVKKRLSEV